jgi:pyruvate ferredoxin oxidoreductase alpha subunit
VIVCLGSTAGTIKDVVDELRADGEPVGALRICSFRPFPSAVVRSSLRSVEAVAVLDRSDSPGGFPPLFAEVAASLHGCAPILRSFVYGLGGRDLHFDAIRHVFDGCGVPLRETTYLGVRSEPCPA